jgi:hypothetical protein
MTNPATGPHTLLESQASSFSTLQLQIPLTEALVLPLEGPYCPAVGTHSATQKEQGQKQDPSQAHPEQHPPGKQV